MDIVLGAGIVGLSIGLHLQARGRTVVLVDKAEPGRATSYGNAGLIERSDLMPRTFPRALGDIAHYAAGQDIRLQYDPLFLPRLAPWLLRYWHNSAPKRAAVVADDITPIFLSSLDEHTALAADVGAAHLLRPGGWLHLYRDGTIPRDTMEGINRARQHGLRVDILEPDDIAAREPMLKQRFAAGIQWQDAASLSDPGELCRLMAAAFVSRGGTVQRGDALTLSATATGWQVATADGKLDGDNAVVALGPWSDDLARRLGYRFGLAVKRGYHVHYEIAPEHRPKWPVIDLANGFVLSPMSAGMRLTTGIEFAHRDAPPTPRQLDRAEPIARAMFELGRRVEPQPWVGSRPVTADMRPIIGPAPRHRGLWFACGHAHHGLTLGPATGRLLAEQMCGEMPFLDPRPLAPARFG